jgi:flagellar protein FlgJ
MEKLAMAGLEAHRLGAPDRPGRTAETSDPGGDARALAAAARQFEALFLEQMLAAMRDTVPEDGLMRGRDEDVYQEMMDRELARSLVEREAYGLADALERQMTPRDGRSDDVAATPSAQRALRAYRDAVGPLPRSNLE